MKRSKLRSLLFVLGILLLAVGCYAPASPDEAPPGEEIAPPDDISTSTLAPTPTPALVGFDSVCEAQPFDEIRVEGFLHVPDRVSCTGEEGEETCVVSLTDLVTRNELVVSLPVGGEQYAPVPHHMLSLPIPYDSTDLMVAAGDGRWAGEGSIVRLTGQAESFGYIPSEGYNCRLVDVSRVEKLEQFSLLDGQARQATLRAALRDGWVEINITGDGLGRIDLKIEPKVDFSLNLEIEVGTVFLSEAAGIQNMVVRKQSFAYLTPGLEAELELEVSCANMSKKQPGRDDTFSVLPDLAPQDLVALLELAEFAFEPVRIQQFSVWTITDNPAPDGYVAITASFSAEGSGPTADELARMRELFQLAGLDLAAYHALQEQ